MNPNLSSDMTEKTLFTLRLFTQDCIDSLAACITPVITANWRFLFPLSVLEYSPPMNSVMPSYVSFPKALFIGLSYSSMSTMGLTPWNLSRRLQRKDRLL